MIGKIILYAFNNDIEAKAKIFDKVLVEKNGASIEKYLVQNLEKEINGTLVQLILPSQITLIF